MQQDFPQPRLEVHFFCSAGKGDASRCVDWAVEALCAGADTPSLRILAGLTDPGDIRWYIERTFEELGIVCMPTEKSADALRMLEMRLLLEKLLAAEETAVVRKCVDELRGYCFESERMTVVTFQFYCISHNWQDADEIEKRDNIPPEESWTPKYERMAREEAARWLDQYGDETGGRAK